MAIIKTENNIIYHDNGMQQDATTGQVITPPDGRITTSERGKELALRRWKANEEAFRQGIHEGLLAGEGIPSADELTVAECREIGKILGATIADPKHRNRLAENVRVAMEIGNLSPNKRTIELEIKSEDPFSEEAKLRESMLQMLGFLQEAIPQPRETVEGTFKGE